jgi:hypothetical protein
MMPDQKVQEKRTASLLFGDNDKALLMQIEALDAVNDHTNVDNPRPHGGLKWNA